MEQEAKFPHSIKRNQEALKSTHTDPCSSTPSVWAWLPSWISEPEHREVRLHTTVPSARELIPQVGCSGILKHTFRNTALGYSKKLLKPLQNLGTRSLKADG